MNAILPPDRLTRLVGKIAEVRPKPGHGELVQVLESVFPDLDWVLVLSRKGWHRVGGVVDRHGNRIADNIEHWIEDEGADDLLDLFVRHEDDGLLATKLCGTTHYLTAKTGENPWDFVQVEVDELREVAYRKLFDSENAPDTLEDLLEPVDPVLVDPTPLGNARYSLREAWDIADAYQGMTSGSYGDSLFMLRIFDDWLASSAHGNGFCRNFVLRIANYKDRFGEMRLQATPVSTVNGGMPPLPGFADRGIDLSHFLTAYDKAAGYPMAWYFNAVAGTDEGLAGVAHAVFEDVTGAYDYLPERDVAVLRHWTAERYTF